MPSRAGNTTLASGIVCLSPWGVPASLPVDSSTLRRSAQDLKSCLSFLLSAPSVCTFCVCVWVRALQCEVRDYTHSRVSFVSVLPCEVFFSPCYMRMSSVLSPLKCLNPFAPCAQCSVLTSVKIKMLLSGAPTLPCLFLCLPLPPSLPLFMVLSTPEAVCFFSPSCAVFCFFVFY